MPIGSRLSNSCTFISKNKRFLFVVLSLALLEISFLRDFIYFEKTGLDPSWMWAMNNIFAFVPGKDWAFTYGPLGFMFVPQMVGNNVFWANLLNNFLPVSLLIGGVGYLPVRWKKCAFPGFRLAGILVAVLSFALSLGIGIFCSVCVFAVFNR